MTRSNWFWVFSSLTCLTIVVGCLPNSSEKPPSGDSSREPFTPTPKVEPAKAPPVSVDPLRRRIEAALASVHGRELLTSNSFWTVFHGILGMGPATMLKDLESGQRYNALDYVFSEAGGNIKGLKFTPTDVGLDVETVGKSPFLKEHEGQGHQDQFVAEMIQWGVPATRPIRIAGVPNRAFTFQDFVSESKARARIDLDQELSWAIVVVADYGGGTEAEWTNRHGHKLKFEQILDYELKADMDRSACGGTHRLFGVAWAYHRHMALCKKQKKQPAPIWVRTKDYLEKYKELSIKWQTPDGEFCTAHYRLEEHNPELEPRLAASGHIFEWLAQYATNEDLASKWMEDGARAVAQIILDSERLPVASGSLYHAAHGLATYHARRYGEKTVRDVAGRPN